MNPIVIWIATAMETLAALFTNLLQQKAQLAIPLNLARREPQNVSPETSVPLETWQIFPV
ncbi:hypothetical protein [Sodalinema gerasimenkoae]|uniref:hypothetical protein n=1 Tax=Sodalinema gerasimenkoae TaxID=2862348 RepID=UPI00135679A4|nr:hypothetical protein [Sodalinema gerasimenkoae]